MITMFIIPLNPSCIGLLTLMMMACEAYMELIQPFHTNNNRPAGVYALRPNCSTSLFITEQLKLIGCAKTL